MKTQPDKNSIQEKILQKIRQGGVKQKPKWRFALQTTFFTAITLGTLLITFYLTAYVALITREHNLLSFINLGSRATFAVIQATPWLIIMLLGIVFLTLQVLVRRYEFAYKNPVLYTLVGTVLLTIGITYGLYSFDKGSRIVRYGEHGEVPFLGGMHKRYLDDKQGDLVRGFLLQINNQEYTVQTRRGPNTITFIVSSSTKMIIDSGTPEVGDFIFAVIEKKEGRSEAVVLRREDRPHKNKDPHRF